MATGQARGNPGQLLLATLTFFICFYVWSLFGPLSPAFQKQLGLTDVEVGWVVAIPVVLGSVMRIPMGIATDRWGARAVFAALLAYTILPVAALIAFHGSFPVLAALGFLLGFAGASFAIGVPFVSRWYDPTRQGFSLGVYGMGMGGTVASALTAPAIAERWGLGAPFVLAAVLIALMAVAWWLLARESPVPRPKATGFAEPLRIFLREPRAWALTLYYFLAFGGFVAMFLYLPKLLVSVYHLQRTDAGARAAGFALLAVLARPAGGWLSDRFGADRVLLAVFAAVAILAAALTGFYAQIVPLTIACLTMAVFLGLGTGAVFKLVGQEFPRQVGAVTGVVGAAGGLGGFFPPIVMATVKSVLGSYTLGFLLLAATAVICLAVLALLRSPRDAPLEERVA